MFVAFFSNLGDSIKNNHGPARMRLLHGRCERDKIECEWWRNCAVEVVRRMELAQMTCHDIYIGTRGW
jgi:hypothetical protein